MSCEILHSDRYEDARWVHDNLYAYNLTRTGEPRQEIILVRDPERKTILAVDAAGVRLGGCCWHVRKVDLDRVLFIDFLWMSESARGTGCGSALIRAAESKALESNCCCIELETNTFQAPGFYQKMGYQVVSERKSPKKNCPGNIHYLFRKTLV